MAGDAIGSEATSGSRSGGQGVVVAVAVHTWPTPPWDWLTWGGAALAAAAPVALYPYSKLVWLAVDRRLREEGSL